jgi:hypothetical protein
VAKAVPEPDDADPFPFPCFICGGDTVRIWNSCTRRCGNCDVLELRHTETYYPHTRTVKGQDWAGGWVSYLDHSAVSLPSPG